MRHIFQILYLLVLIYAAASCKSGGDSVVSEGGVREHLVDTVGFARFPWQMDSLMARITRKKWDEAPGEAWDMVICPHDDYTYVGKLYPELLKNVRAKNLVLIGVAHKAAQMGIENNLVFDSFSAWKGPWKNVAVSAAREELLKILSGKYAVVSDTLHSVEHSLEALIPYLQYFNRDISIVPVLVPAMSPGRMDECGKALAGAIRQVAKRNRWEWGSDFAIIATTDAVHYGNEEWGGSDYAFYGCDQKGNQEAVNHEYEIINNCLSGIITPEKISLFSNYTLDPEDFHKYRWTWCGRYSVPVALYTSYYLNENRPVSGDPAGYSSSLESDHIPVEDIRMGKTAIATACHWVGYAAIGYHASGNKK